MRNAGKAGESIEADRDLGGPFFLNSTVVIFGTRYVPFVALIHSLKFRLKNGPSKSDAINIIGLY